MKKKLTGKFLRKIEQAQIKCMEEPFSDESILIGKLDEFPDLDYLDFGNIMIIYDDVILVPNYPHIENEVALIIKIRSRQCLGLGFQFDDDGYLEREVQVCECFKDGTVHSKIPNGIIHVKAGNGFEPVLTIDVGYDEKSLEQLVLDMVTYLTKYTKVKYSVGLKMFAEKRTFRMEFLVLKRVNEPEFEALERLTRTETKENIPQEPCVVSDERATSQKISQLLSAEEGTVFEFFDTQVEIIRHLQITEANLTSGVNDSLDFYLDAADFDSDENGPQKVTVSAEMVAIIERFWELYKD